MPSDIYSRRDVVLALSELDGAIRAVLNGQSEAIFGSDPLSKGVADWPPLQAALAGTSWGSAIDRLVIEVSDDQLAAIDWESALRTSGYALVRSTRVLPRVRNIPLTFPIRLLETGDTHVAGDAVRGVFNNRDRSYAMTTAQSALGKAQGFLESSGWNTAEILHVHDLSPDESMLRSSRSGEPGSVGWLLRFANAWQTRLILLEGTGAALPLLRRAAHAIIERGGPAVWVIDPAAFDVLEAYAKIIHDRPLDWIQQQYHGGTLFAGGGREDLLRYSAIGDQLAEPAVADEVVVQLTRDMPVSYDLSFPTRTSTGDSSNKDDVIEAEVVDENKCLLPESDVEKIVQEACADLEIQCDDKLVSLRWIRPNRLQRLDDSISSALARQGYVVPPLERTFRPDDMPLGEIVSTYITEAESITPDNAARAIGQRVHQFESMMPEMQFDEHESDGMLPLAQKVSSIRALRQAARQSSMELGLAWPAPRGPRSVNAFFAEEKDGGPPARIPQRGARLAPDVVVHLAVSIGQPDEEIVTAGTTEWIEERIEWEAGADGAWIEIGVAGIDFDVLGDPVQEVWLPRYDDMKTPVTFAVRPQHHTSVPGVARLRLTIFHKNNLVQSFLMAALLTDAPDDGDPLLAGVLDVRATEKNTGAGYLMRMEYDTVGDLGNAGSVQERGLTIIANESAGEKVTTFKGDDLFETKRGPLLTSKVQAAREALKQASMSGGHYRYTYRENEPNSGNPDNLLGALWEIALAGWDLFNFFVPRLRQQDKVRETLAKGTGIHAAHLDLSNVIPWSLIYDRPVEWTEKLSEDASDPHARVFDLRRALCPAGMPANDGTVSRAPCKQEATCLLHPANVEAEKNAGGPIVTEATVICPRRFWGFTHPIEVPVQQVDPDETSTTKGLQPFIECSKPAELVAGFNTHLELAKDHRTEIETFCTDTGLAKMVTAAEQKRDFVQQILRKTTPAIVYIYCHAYTEAEEDNRKIGANLNFGEKPTIRDGLTASQLSGDPWVHRPLVFLNGCSTVGFDPCAPSEFITQFVQGREASAVIGTEVTVWEILAGEVAREFLREFVVAEKNAGDALLLVRGKLLLKANPLGLVYTLYGSSSLAMKWSN